MLRLFIEFLGVKGDRKSANSLITDEGNEPDDLRLNAFRSWGIENLEPGSFGTEYDPNQSFFRAYSQRYPKAPFPRLLSDER